MDDLNNYRKFENYRRVRNDNSVIVLGGGFFWETVDHIFRRGTINIENRKNVNYFEARRLSKDINGIISDVQSSRTNRDEFSTADSGRNRTRTIIFEIDCARSNGPATRSPYQRNRSVHNTVR